MGEQPVRVGIDAGALMLNRSAPGTAKFVREQTTALLEQPVPWEWVICVPRGHAELLPTGRGRTIVEVTGSKYSVFATWTAGRCFRRHRCVAALSPAGMSAFFSPLVANYFDSNLFEYGLSAVTSRDRARYRFLRATAKDTFRRAQVVFVNSEYCADVLRRFFPQHRSKFRANPVGIAPPAPVPEARPDWATADMDARGFILCSSAFLDNKNQRRLIEAYVELQSSGRELPPLVLIGPCQPAYMAEVIRPVLRTSLRPADIVIPGHVTDDVLAWAFAHACLVVQPSFAEGFSSFSVFQAMQRGVPVACANTTSHPEAVGDAAVLFNPSSVPDIAGVMARALDDEALRARLASVGLQRVRELTWTANAGRVCAALAKIVGVPGATVQ